MPTMRVATVQFELRAERSPEALLNHMESYVDRAARAGARIVVFPELIDTGLLGAIDDHDVTTQTVPDDYWKVLPKFTPALLEGFTALAKKHKITILGGSLLRIDDEGQLRNTAYLVHHDGTVTAQDKIHLTPQEHALGLRAGDSLSVAQVDGRTVGVLICADIQYPELSRYLERRGAEIILCPSLTWNRRGVHRVKTGSQARAMENQLFVVMSPLVGNSGLPTDAPMYAVGEALCAVPVDKVFGENDGLLASTGEITGEITGEDLLLCELDFDRLKRSRENPESPGLALRRPELYAQLAEGQG